MWEGIGLINQCEELIHKLNIKRRLFYNDAGLDYRNVDYAIKTGKNNLSNEQQIALRQTLYDYIGRAKALKDHEH
jgi:hypothetical protein